MILDWKNDREFALQNGVIEYNDSIYFCGKSRGDVETDKDICSLIHSNGIFKDVIFKNFPNIHINNSTYENCIFESCGDVYIGEGVMIYCKVTNSDFIVADGTVFYDCLFADSKSFITFLSVDNKCKVDGCTFENITVRGFETQLCRMNGDKEKDIRYLTNCKFINCVLENPNCQLSTYIYNTFFVKDCKKENIDGSCEIINNQ